MSMKIKLRLNDDDNSEQALAINDDNEVVWTSPRAPEGAWESLFVPKGEDAIDNDGVIRTLTPEYHATVAWLESGLNFSSLNEALMLRLHHMGWVEA